MNKKYYLVAIIALVIFVSGCTQVSTLTEAFKKLKALEAGPGYSVDYIMNFKVELNEKFKEAVKKDPQAAAGLAQLENQPAINLDISGAKKGDKERSSVDVSGLAGQESLGVAALPFKKMIVYQDKNDATICLETDKETVCTKSTKGELSKKAPGLAQQINSANQFSSQSPDKLLAGFKALYDKGALKLGPQGKDTVIGRGCDKISYTVSDFSKLEGKEVLSALGPLGSQLSGTTGVSEDQITQAAFLLKQIIKDVKQEFCLDSQNGLPLSSTYSLQLDLSNLMKLIASGFGVSGDEVTKDIPQGAGFSMVFTTAAKSVKTPIDDSEFALPKDVKVVSADQLLEKFPELNPINIQTASSGSLATS